MQQTHGSLRSQGEPSVCRLSYAAYSAADEALLPGAAEPLSPFGCMGALHSMHQTAPRISLPIQCRTGLSLLVKQSLGSLRSQCVSPPSVVGVMLRTRRRTRLSLPVQQSCRLPSVTVGALHPTRQTAPRFQLQEGLSLPVQQSRSSLRTQRESLI